MMTELVQQKCEACRVDAATVSESELQAFCQQVPAWNLVTNNGVRQLEREFPFQDYLQALAFTQKVGEVAQAEGHHPALLTEWGKVTVTWWTHKIKGLHRNDFIMAAKTDTLYSK